MKRIIISLSAVIYLLVFVFTFSYVREREYKKLSFEKYEHIQIANWEKNCTNKEKLNQIKNYAIDSESIIIKKQYDKDSEKEIYYCALGNVQDFCDILKIEYDYVSLALEKDKSWIISNMKLGLNNQIYKMNVFCDSEIQYKDITSDEVNSVVGEYIIIGDKEDFLDKMNFEESSVVSMENSSFYFIIIILSVIILSIYLLTYMQYMIQHQKQVAICKLHGWDEKNIILNVFVKNEIRNNIIGIGISSVIAVIYILRIKLGSSILVFFEYFAFFTLITLVSILMVSFIIFCILKYIDASVVIKNKRPEKIVRWVNYLLKIMLIFSLCVIGVLQASQFREIIVSYNMINKIESISEYATFNVNSMYALTDQIEAIAGITPRLRELYNRENEKGAILSCNISLQFGEVMFINGNYLNENAILDADGNKITEEQIEKNSINVLVPEYLSTKINVIESQINNWLDNQKMLEEYFEDNIEGYRPPQLEDVNINYSYIKDNQKLFTYKIESKESVNQVIIVAEGNCLANDTYLTFFATNSVLLRVNTEKNIFSQLENDVISCGLQEEIIDAELITDHYDNYLWVLKQYLAIFVMIGVMLFLFLALVIYYVCDNYLEYSKKDRAIEYIHGYNLFQRHKNYYISEVCILTGVLLFVFLFGVFMSGIFMLSVDEYLMYSVIVWEIILIFNLVLSLIIIVFLERKKITDILKGA